MKSVALHNLGCKVNSYEMEVMQQKLSENGYKIVPFAPGADIYLINTCTVTNIADRKSRQMLHKAKKMNPEAIVVATGCYVQTGTEELQMDDCIDLAVGNNKKKDIVDILEAYLQEKETSTEGNSVDKTLHNTTVIDINHTDEYEEMTLTQTGDHTRAYIKIQDGCNQFCAYCAIPYARGRVRSRNKQDILNEIEGLVAAGYQEVVITGIHLSSYGLDFITKESTDYLNVSKDIRQAVYEKEYLLDLLSEIQQIEGLHRIRLGSLEPRIVTEQFARKLSSFSKVCPHFHLSLQSGADSTLRRMNRRYTTAEFLEGVRCLRKAFVNPAITTDVITGFPGETKEEFEQTYEFVEQIAFYEMHVFKYSKRKGTVAATMENQIPESVKEERSRKLLDLTKVQSKDFREKFLGTQIVALMEEEKVIKGERYMVGHTPHYVRVACKTDRNLSNYMVKGEAVSFLEDDILLISKEFTTV